MFELWEFVKWFVAMEALGVITFPIALPALKGMKDKGYGASKLLGLLFLSFLAFMLSYLTKFTIAVWIAFLLLAVACVFRAFAMKKELTQCINDKNFRKTVLAIEIMFLVCLAGFSFFRAVDPDIEDGEKRMEFAFVNAVERSESMPPAYPWYSGESLGKYYYFGHLMVAALSSLAAVKTSIAYNLAIAAFFALSAIMAFSIGISLTRKKKYAILFPFFVLLLSNVFVVLQIAYFVSPTFDLGIAGYEPAKEGPFLDKLLSTDTVWWSTRIIPWTVNEFPFFSFIWADLHHTLMAIPFRMLVIFLAMSLYGLFLSGAGKKESAGIVLLLALSLGSMILLSTWDYPIMALFITLAVAFAAWKKNRSIPASLKTMATYMVPILLLSLALFYPALGPLMDGRGDKLQLETEWKTSLYHFTILFLPFLALMALMAVKRRLPRLASARRFLSESFVLLAAIALLSTFEILIWIVPIAAASVALLKKSGNKHENFALLMVLAGSFVALFADIINVGGRYISLFKFYLQLWVFWSLASAYAIYSLRHSLWAKKRKITMLGAGIFVILALATVYTLVGGYIEIFKKNEGRQYLTLDGTDYLKAPHPYDYNAIEWINSNINGSPVILEAPGRSYTYTSRVSWATGLPTVLGWEHHVEGHLSIDYAALINGRNADIDAVYNTTNNSKALELLKKYNVTYVYVGELEKNYQGINRDGQSETRQYASEGLKKFRENSAHYLQVYSNRMVEIYKVIA